MNDSSPPLGATPTVDGEPAAAGGAAHVTTVVFAPPAPSAADHLGWLEDAMSRFTAVLAEADPGLPVPSCPGWALADLATHLGQVHAWARGAILSGTPETALPPAPPPHELALWYRDRADDLLETLGSTDPQLETWTFGPRPRTAAFWFRRQHHETSMHLWDALVAAGAEGAAGAAGAVGAPALGYGGPGAPSSVLRAADAVSEVAELFVPRQLRLGRIPPLPGTLELVASDLRGHWILGPDHASHAGRATVTGPAHDLALMLWRRADPGAPGHELALEGDPEAASAVLALALTP